MHFPSSPTLKQLSIIALLYFLGVKLGLVFAVKPQTQVLLWLPNGLLLVALAHYRFKRFWLFALFVLAAEVIADYPTYSFLESVAYGLVNLFEATFTFTLLSRWKLNSRFRSPSDLGKFMMAGPIIAALISAFAAGIVNAMFHNDETGYLEFVRVWWFSDATGLMIAVPLAWSVWPIESRSQPREFSPQKFDLLAAALAVLVVALLLAADRGRVEGFQIRPIWLFPFVLYAAARLGMRATILVLVVFSGVLLFVTSNGQQPFGELSVRETIMQTQQVIFIMSSMSLGLAALLAQLHATNRALEARVQRRTAELSAANERLSKLATTDPLTGALNRRALVEVMAKEFDRHRRHGRTLAIVMFDIDHFKHVNDRFGHAAGDLVLRQSAELTSRLIRASDVLARYGGEEFVVVAPETDLESAVELSERIRTTLLLADMRLTTQELHITASFGIATLQDDDASPEALLTRADLALYAAKRNGRNRIAIDARISEVRSAI